MLSDDHLRSIYDQYGQKGLQTIAKYTYNYDDEGVFKRFSGTDNPEMRNLATCLKFIFNPNKKSQRNVLTST